MQLQNRRRARLHRQLSANEIKQLYNLGQSKIGHSNVAISNGLVGYWTFDGKDTNWATGKTNDISGQGNDGQLLSMSTTTSPAYGKIGQAFSFNGVDSNVLGPHNDILRTMSSLTVSAWVKKSSNGSVVSYDGNSFGAYFMDVAATGRADFAVSDGGAWYAASSVTTLATSTWNHIVGVWTGSTVSIYINGKFENSLAANITLAGGSSDNYLRIGRDGWDGGPAYFPGTIDDVRIYNRALSDNEIKQLYSLGTNKVAHSNPIISNGLVGYWTFDGGSIDWHTNTVRDMSGTGNTAYMKDLFFYDHYSSRRQNRSGVQIQRLHELAQCADKSLIGSFGQCGDFVGLV
jgi:hypothetical protein